jgi:periplasmic protein TonB
MAEQPKPRRIFVLALTVGVVVLLTLAVWGVRHLLAGQVKKPERTVQVVQVIRPPPPPEQTPPPPPPQEKTEQPIPQDEPEPTPANAAPSQQLGLDADGSSGGDAFGLAAHKGGQSITGGGGAIFAWYTQLLKDALIERLSNDRQLRSKSFSVLVKVWISPDGQVQSVKLGSSSGSRETDALLEETINRVGRLRQAPPIEMPQPISLRIGSKS